MAGFQYHLHVVESNSKSCPSVPAFKVPIELDGRIVEWKTISYGQFQSDIEHFARYWYQTLTNDQIPPRSVIGLWVTGATYLDLLHIYSITRAGFIPQLFSLRLANADVVYELLRKSNGKGLIFDSSFAELINGSLPAYSNKDLTGVQVKGYLPEIYQPTSGEEPMMIFHTSGSTSGSPKLVPCSFEWWDFAMKKSNIIATPLSSRQDTALWMGSLCHIAQSFILLGNLKQKTCTVQYTKQGFSSDELKDMIKRCGLTRIYQFPSFLRTHIQNSRYDPELLAGLQSMDEIFMTGMPLLDDDAAWAAEKNLKIVNCFGMTELGALLISNVQDGPKGPLSPIEGTKYFFIRPEGSAELNDNPLLELVVSSNSPNCPDRSLRAEDGHFHTGDLFSEPSPGAYVYQGRNDDWIKMENALRCNTKAIEDNVLATCGHLISSCVVVGTGRPSPSLIIESNTADEEQLKQTIFESIRGFHSRLYLHERIMSEKYILVVPIGTLPRTATKGNIRRKLVEQSFKLDLDEIYEDPDMVVTNVVISPKNESIIETVTNGDPNSKAW